MRTPSSLWAELAAAGVSWLRRRKLFFPSWLASKGGKKKTESWRPSTGWAHESTHFIRGRLLAPFALFQSDSRRCWWWALCKFYVSENYLAVKYFLLLDGGNFFFFSSRRRKSRFSGISESVWSGLDGDNMKSDFYSRWNGNFSGSIGIM